MSVKAVRHRPVSILGVPFNGDGTPPSVEDPPGHLREAGLVERLAMNRVVDELGDMPVPSADGLRDPRTGVLNWSSWCTVSRRLKSRIAELVATGGWPLVLGGDCSILVGIVAGLVQGGTRVGLVFIDGHADFHTPATSPTGEPADMELAVLTGRGPSPLASDKRTGPVLRDDEVVAFGIREWEGVRESGIRVWDKASLVAGGLSEVARQGLLALPAELPLWLHFDVDVIDPREMPVLFPAENGLSFLETRTLLQTVLASGRVVGMDVACFHPNLDRNGAATASLVDLLVEVLSTPDSKADVHGGAAVVRGRRL